MRAKERWCRLRYESITSARFRLFHPVEVVLVFGFYDFFDEFNGERLGVFKAECALTFFVWLNLLL